MSKSQGKRKCGGKVTDVVNQGSTSPTMLMDVCERFCCQDPDETNPGFLLQKAGWLTCPHAAWSVHVPIYLCEAFQRPSKTGVFALLCYLAHPLF